MHRLATIGADDVRFLIMTGIEAMKEAATLAATVGSTPPPQQLALWQAESAKGWAIFFFLMSVNHMTILGNTGRFLDTTSGGGCFTLPGALGAMLCCECGEVY